MARPRKGEPKERKVTARFSLAEYRALIDEAKCRGQPVSPMLREVVVLSLEAMREKLERNT